MELPGIDTTKAPRWRKSSDGTEETIKAQPIKDAVADLMKLYVKLDTAKEDFQSALRGVAERSNANASTIKKLIASSYKGNFEDKRREAEQQAVLFEAVGEVPTGAVTEVN